MALARLNHEGLCWALEQADRLERELGRMAKRDRKEMRCTTCERQLAYTGMSRAAKEWMERWAILPSGRTERHMKIIPGS